MITDDDDLLGLTDIVIPMTDTILPPRTEAFVQEFYRTSNAFQSYRKTYNDVENNATHRHAAMMVKNSQRVQARLKELRADLANQVIMDKAQVLNELAKIAMFDARNLFDDEGKLIPIHMLDDDTAASVASFDTESVMQPVHPDDAPDAPRRYAQVPIKVKMADKRAALVDIGKALGMFSDKVEVTGKDGKDLIPEETSPTELARRVAFLLTSGLLTK